MGIVAMFATGARQRDDAVAALLQASGGDVSLARRALEEEAQARGSNFDLPQESVIARIRRLRAAGDD